MLFSFTACFRGSHRKCHLDLVVQMIKCKCDEVPMRWRIMLYHGEAVMAAVIFTVSPCIQKRMFFPGEKNWLLFFHYMHRKTYSLEISEPHLAYILKCVCNHPEYEATYNGGFCPISSQKIPT